ncbi:MAG TPA: metal ABC transporter ATP-binding protein [Terriglobales bacterium]|nr:metal ABC transporter ATP-binding protein [Terriglobales bacterium]
MLSAPQSPLLSVHNLSVGFGNRSVIRDLSFEVAARENLAIIGPNGAGKTVLLRALLNLVPYQGAIRWAQGVRLGYVPQSIAADRRLPLHVRDLLKAKADILKLPASSIGEAVRIVNLAPELLDTRVGVLSGGQFQKVLITFALLGNPNVLLVDEPTASLDELAQEHIYELLERLRLERGLTVLLVSHDLSVVYQFATKVLCLGSGTPCYGPPRDILTPQTLAAVYSAVPKFYHHVHDSGAHRD